MSTTDDSEHDHLWQLLSVADHPDRAIFFEIHYYLICGTENKGRERRVDYSAPAEFLSSGIPPLLFPVRRGLSDDEVERLGSDDEVERLGSDDEVERLGSDDEVERQGRWGWEWRRVGELVLGKDNVSRSPIQQKWLG
ncbi:hypothetical protein BC938DRAFT_479159 [Jimgerdemannia flammicorona]|uniref:Uncharacterized protein n=1 Tax=Jimgerdemannia flammicorona TaxID=994334 RepID=A0A433QXZ5_9FUNG|nr:hypothetical protein BC938DRAFT_479159 [Jimgerdemannia flammicorona]